MPIGKQLTYFYRPHREGTYMYHCHFEDVEHVQMGMTGIVFVRPLQDGTVASAGSPSSPTTTATARPATTGTSRSCSTRSGRTSTTATATSRRSIATDYDPQWFTLNGRVLPADRAAERRPESADDLRIATPNPNYDDAIDYSQPNSALIQVNPGERVLLRLANLGYQQHAMQLPGIPMHVVGQDASLLRNGSVDTSYWTNTLYIGPGEARDVLFDAPAYDAARPSGSDGRGAYNVYHFKNRDWRRLSNDGAAGPGGMMTEVRVYQNPLPAQTVVSQTYV